MKLAKDWRFYDSDSERLQSCVLSCLVRNPRWTLELLYEFGITDKDFEPIGVKQLFSHLREGTVFNLSVKESYSPFELLAMYYKDYLPTAANARYYVEEFYNLKKKNGDQA